MKKKQVIGLIILGFVVVGLGAATIWVLDSSKPMVEATNALISDDSVEVESDQWISFTPTQTTPTMGFIFYPGGKVEPESYAPLARAIAEEGYLVTIVPMPLNLAVLDINAAEEVIDHYDTITTWAIGGHSLGGTMAARYIFDHPDDVSCLVLLASYPADSDDLSNYSIEVVSIYGSEDTVLDGDSLTASENLLPTNTAFIEVTGGNHAQFGYYGEQSGDSPATISREEQHLQTVQAINSTFGSL